MHSFLMNVSCSLRNVTFIWLKIISLLAGGTTQYIEFCQHVLEKQLF
jgi:hypothetical protein